MERLALLQQIDALRALGYPKLLRMSVSEFQSTLAPLQRFVPAASEPCVDLDAGRVAFALVINTPLAPVRATLPLIRRLEEAAFEQLFPRQPEQFKPIGSVELAGGQAYLLIDIDRGNESLNVTPDEALESINAAGRSPLTLEEGVALLTQFPALLRPNRCFSLLGSRCGDKRVPAIWLSEKRPKLGWCWAGNPHTWLGSASCGGRSQGVDLHAGSQAPDSTA